jgi:UDPglucose--hexose-1-phosphate uridylyltransferase
MPQLRQNYVLKEWVIIATERAKRPEQLKENKNIAEMNIPPYDENCPLCPGNEVKFGNTTEIFRDGGEKDWKLRVIPNKFPALAPMNEDEVRINTTGYLRWMDGIGNHEVLIEHPSHNLTIATMDPSIVLNVLKSYQIRLKSLMELSYIESVIIFRNHGTRAGASLLHPHSQIIALPIIPRDVIARMNESIRYQEEHRECIFCRVMKSEMEDGSRIIIDSKHFVVFVPYAAYSPFSMWLYPKRHCSSFLDVTAEELAEMSTVLRQALRKLYYGLNDPDYNYIIRSSPKGYQNSAFFHWYMTIVPRMTRTAGFELGSGMYINPSIPEENAAYLKSITD